MSVATVAATTIDTARADLVRAVDGYAVNLPSYRVDSYLETNQARLEGLIQHLAKNPDLLGSNLEELFNRTTIALLDRKAD